jgi:hypothetical protein
MEFIDKQRAELCHVLCLDTELSACVAAAIIAGTGACDRAFHIQLAL